MFYLIFAILFLFTSCNLSLPYEERAEYILPSPSLETSSARSLDTPFFTLGDWPENCWWEMFNAPDLNVLIAEALLQNPSILEMKARLEVAEREAIIVRSALFPLVVFNAKETKSFLSKNGLYRALNPTIPLNNDLIDLALSFNYEFDFWGKNRNLFFASIGDALAAEAEKSQVELITTTALAQAYFALKVNYSRQSLYERLYFIRSEELRIQNLLKRHALSSKLRPLALQEDLFHVKQNMAMIQEEIEFNEHLINVLAGKTPDADVKIDPFLQEIPEYIAIPSNLSCDLIARRPDLMAQIWLSESLAHKVGAAIADYYPDFNLSGFIGLESTSFAKLFQWSSKTWALQPAIHLPIFTAGAIRANISARNAEFDAAIFAYNALLLKSAQEVADNLSFSSSIFTQRKEQKEILKDAKERYNLSILRKETGLDTILDNYLMEEQLIERELENLKLIYNQYVAVINLIKSLGGGYYSDTVPIKALECSL